MYNVYVDLLEKNIFTSVVERRILNSEFSLKRQLVSICVLFLLLRNLSCVPVLLRRGEGYVVDQHEITSTGATPRI